MTKSLTEKWKDDTLPDGYYYTKKITYPETYPSCDEHIIESIDLYSCDYGFDDDMDITKVLAPVPEYHTWKNVSEQWKVAIPQIERQNKRIEKLEQQLAEANEVIKDYVFHEYLTPETYEMRHKLEVYCQKWGVK